MRERETYCNHPCPKLDANSQVVDGLEPLVRELEQEARLAHARVPDDNVLEKIPAGVGRNERESRRQRKPSKRVGTDVWRVRMRVKEMKTITS